MAEASARAPLQGDPGTSAAAAGEPQYLPYKSIADALKQGPSRRVCLFAAVAEIGRALKSSGGTGDYYVTLRIVDKSHPAGVSATIFAENTAQLPRVKSTGDVISLHDVEIQTHKESYFYVTFRKNKSSFALFGSKVSDDFSPYETSMSNKYHRNSHDKELLTQMRTWLASLHDNSLGLKDLELELSRLKSDSTFDLVCKVLYVLEDNGTWIVYVWDGTDTPAAEFQTISDAQVVERTPLHLGPPLARNVVCTMPCVGTVLRVFSDSSLKEAQHRQMGIHWAKFCKIMQKGICWARFCNITCKQEFGIWKGIFGPSSRVRLLSDEDGRVVVRRKMYDTRNRRPMTSFVSNVTDVDDSKKGRYSTLMESLTYDKVPHIVKTLVRVVAAYHCQACKDHFIRLILEDPTARIHACVPKDDLVTFFGGPPTEEVMIKKMKKLLGVPEAEDSEEVAPLTMNPPWVWCLLKSYYLDENDRLGSRRYQIYGTTIRD